LLYFVRQTINLKAFRGFIFVGCQSTNHCLPSPIPDIISKIFIFKNWRWDEVIKKEGRGLYDYDLGEVQEVDEEHVITKKGLVDKDKFYLPRNKVNRFDGNKLWFEVTKDVAKLYKHD